MTQEKKPRDVNAAWTTWLASNDVVLHILYPVFSK